MNVVNWKKISLILLAFLIIHIPYLGTFLRAINTMIHESGHALLALLLKGDVHSISLFANLEGVTISSYTSILAGIVISLSGYVFASAMLLVFSYLWYKRKYEWMIVNLTVLSAINLLFWVRNLYGVFWLLLFIILLVLLLTLKKRNLKEIATFMILLILMSDTIRASFIILWLSVVSPNNAGDATNLGSLTFIPAFLWGAFFLFQALWFAQKSFQYLFLKK